MKSINELFQSCENINDSFDSVMAAMSGLDSNEIQAMICKIITAVCESIEEDVIEYAFSIFETLVEEEPIKHCPICGCSVSVKQSDNGKFYIDCCYCPLKTEPIFRSRAEAIDYFNDRM